MGKTGRKRRARPTLEVWDSKAPSPRDGALLVVLTPPCSGTHTELRLPSDT